MKLEKFKEKNNKVIGVVLFTIICIALIGSVILYKTFASFEVNHNFNIINGTIEDTGNIYFAFYVDNQIQTGMPSKESGYVLDENKSYCGVTDKVDPDIKVFVTEDYEIHVKGVTTSRTKCNLYFVRGEYLLGKGVPIIKNGNGLYEVKHENLDGTIDNSGFQTTEYRYAGENPNNYVKFNGELWRMIGLVNVMTSETKVEQRVKIVKNDTIGSYSWDSSEPEINGGNGVNEWSQADLESELNNFYLNSLKGSCYNGSNNVFTDCDFTDTGIKEKYRNFIENVFWNTGSNKNTNDPLYSDVLDDMYIFERSTNTGKTCTSGIYACSDQVERKYLVNGNIGLMYPTDYGYAVGGTEEYRESILKGKLGEYRGTTNWIQAMIKDKNTWLLTPVAYNERADHIYFMHLHNGLNYNAVVADAFQVFPTLYLKSNIKIISGTGTLNDAYELVQILK